MNGNLTELEKKFYHIFNTGYKSFLNNTPHLFFMHDTLEKIINVLSSQMGFIGIFVDSDDESFLSINTIYNKCHTEKEFNIPNNIIIPVDKTKPCYESVFNDKILFIENLSELNQLITNFSDPIKSYLIVPIVYDSKVIGMLGLFNCGIYNISIEPSLKTLSRLLGVLINNTSNDTEHITSNDSNRFITFQLMENILSTTSDSTIVINCKSEVIYTNSNADKLIKSIEPNISTNQINISQVFPQLKILEQNEQKTRRLFRNRKIAINIKDPQRISLNVIVNSVICNNKIYHVIVIHDVTDSVLTDEKILKNQSLMVGFLSHELRNPLQSITLSSYLLDNMIQINEKTKKQISIISKSCADMRRIIDDILDLSKIDADEFSVEIEECEIKDMLETIFEEYVPIIDCKNINFTYFIESDTPNKLFTDSVRIRQILSNLISNAVKYTRKGSIEIKVKYDSQKKTVMFDVIDTGIGISEGEMDCVFTKFCRISNNKKLNIPTNGLGLYLSQKIAGYLGGYITVRSEANKGSVFSLVHPINLQHSNSKLNLRELKIPTGMSGNVLIVDDNENNATVLKMLLEQFNYQYTVSIKVDVINSGKDAIKLAKINNYDIIFMDINMDGLDGVTTSKLLKASECTAIIIATTGNISITKCSEPTFDDVIYKPFDNQDIYHAIHTYLKNKNYTNC